MAKQAEAAQVAELGDEEKIKRKLRTIQAKATEALEECEELMKQVLQEYRAARRAVDPQRKKNGQFKTIPMPQIKITGAGAVRAYWREYHPIMKNGKPTGDIRRSSAKQIKQAKTGSEVYPEKLLARFTDDLDHELVMQTEQRLRPIESTASVCHRIRRLIQEELDQ